MWEKVNKLRKKSKINTYTTFLHNPPSNTSHMQREKQKVLFGNVRIPLLVEN